MLFHGTHAHEHTPKKKKKPFLIPNCGNVHNHSNIRLEKNGDYIDEEKIKTKKIL